MKRKIHEYLLFPLVLLTMLYIYPMWSNEVERIGLQKCTPRGYVLRALAEIFGFVGGLFFLAALFGAAFRRFGIICLCASLALGVTGRILFMTAYWLAAKRRYHYDEKQNIASWVVNDVRITYDLAQLKNETKV